MSSIRRILVAVADTGAALPPAVVKAAQLAQALRARVELFHPLSAPVYADPYLTGGPSEAEVKRELEARHLGGLERMAKRIRSRSVRVDVGVEWDYPSFEAIVRRALRTRAGIIFADCQARRNLFASLLQVADWELIKLSPLPVMLVKQPGRYRRPSLLAAVDPSHAFAKPARLDREILRLGQLVARALRGKLHAMHAHVPVASALPGSPAMRRLAAEHRSDARLEARAAFAQVLKGSRIPLARRHLVELRPERAIPEVARRTRSAIVIMGAVSRSGLKSVFIGNTAQRVVDDLASDLLVVKPAGTATELRRKVRGKARGKRPPPVVPASRAARKRRRGARG